MGVAVKNSSVKNYFVGCTGQIVELSAPGPTVQWAHSGKRALVNPKKIQWGGCGGVSKGGQPNKGNGGKKSKGAKWVQHFDQQGRSFFRRSSQTMNSTQKDLS